jgi:predicted nucleotidyltransferase
MVIRRHQEILGIGYFGSYAKGNWGVGSDLDLVIMVKSSAQPFEMRATEFDVTQLPVPVDLLVYTRKEWQNLSNRGRWQQAMKEIVWIYLGE